MKRQVKELLLVTGSRNTQLTIARQLRECLDQSVEIWPFMVNENSRNPTKQYFVVFSSQEVYEDFLAMGNGDFISDYIIATRTALYSRLDKILMLPRDEKILLVNDSEQSAMETLDCLKRSGFDFLDYVQYYAGCGTDIRGIRIAVTPGELDKIPKGISEVYDIGVRVMDFSGIIRILRKFNLPDDRVQRYADLYIENVVNFAKRVANAVNETKQMNDAVRTEIIGRGYYAKYHFNDIIGKTDEIKTTKKIAEKIAKTDLTVLIEGENGTGKELFASAIHNASYRAKKPFVAVNFSVLPDELIESELFGYEEGSFTGAKKGGKSGLFQQANGGTLFLDEIGDISLKMQAKLLRVIQEKEIMKVGAERIIPVDVRIIAAANRDLTEMIEEKSFRKDLYYRLKMGYLYLSPLRERKADVPLMVRYWINSKYGNEIELDQNMMEHFMEYDWPGNVRELLNQIKYAVAVCENNRITAADLPYENAASFQIGYKEPRPAEKGEKAVMFASRRSHAATLPPVHVAMPRYSHVAMDKNAVKLIRIVAEINESGELASRKRIQEALRLRGAKISEYKVRKLLGELAGEGYLLHRPGSYGLQVSQLGEALMGKKNGNNGETATKMKRSNLYFLDRNKAYEKRWTFKNKRLLYTHRFCKILLPTVSICGF